MIAANNTPLVIDAGANIGLGSIFLSRLFPAASFILVEPDQDNVAIAALNVKQHANMSIVQCALWHETTRLYIRTSRDASTLKVISERESGAVAVATTTINELIAGRKDDLFLVKMDIEGAESNVLSLNCAWLDALPILLIEPHDQWQPNNNSLAGVLSIPEYRKADIIVNNKIIIFIPRRFCA
jgi:FkbM family methyltransferase